MEDILKLNATITLNGGCKIVISGRINKLDDVPSYIVYQVKELSEFLNKKYKEE